MKEVIAFILMVVIRNWKTSATGIAALFILFADAYGLQISQETKDHLIGLLVGVGFIFAKDVNKTKDGQTVHPK